MAADMALAQYRSGAWKAVQRSLRHQVVENAETYRAQALLNLDIMFE